MDAAKRIEIEASLSKLLADRSEISLQDVAYAVGLSKSNEAHRKAIRRVLNELIGQGVLEARGKARARTYHRKSVALHTTENLFKDFALSAESNTLLKSVSQPLQTRVPVGYNQDFLSSYIPNHTFYLSKSQRAELLQVGSVEPTVRPAGTYARHIINRLLIDLSWNSSRLEGNTYSLLETKRLIEFGENAAGKDASEAQMILNHKSAIEYIVDSAADEQISAHEIFSIHALLSENLLGDPSASGRIRQIGVGVGGSTYLPLENHHVLHECFRLLIEKLNLIQDPFEQSLFSLVHLSYLQAFEDVNKRTARLVANIPLIKKNLRPLSFTDIEQEAYVKALLGVYEKNDVSLFRDLYIWAYKRSSQKYSAIQQAMGEPNLLKLKYRAAIKEIIRALILERVAGQKVVHRIRSLIETQQIPDEDAVEVFNLIEAEVLSLHEGNIARYQIRPSEFEAWKNLQH